MTIYSKMFALFIKIKWKCNFQFLSLGLAEILYVTNTAIGMLH